MNKVVDFHCDVLSKLWEHPASDFMEGSGLDVSLQTMEQGDVVLQVFAVYLSERFGRPNMERVMAQLEIFRQKLVEPGHITWLKWRDQAADLRLNNNRRWGVLSLEGVDGLEGNLFYVRLCYEMGVRLMGLTWNHANWAADGVMEKRGGGLTNKGRKLLKLMNELGIVPDVSHLSPAGFWELAELTQSPFIASHSNAYEICRHPRNLTDEQIRALIAVDGLIGVTFVPWFVRCDVPVVKMEDLLPHVERICELGGAKHLVFGSDFDGIDRWIKGLESPARYPDWAALLLKHYPEPLVRDWMSGNAITFLEKNLPQRPLPST